MTLQTSGAISLANIQTEFGGTNPISLNEYYAGGSFVPSGTSGTNGAVPTSGLISFSQLYGTSAASVTVTLPSFISVNTLDQFATNQAIVFLQNNGKLNEFTSDNGDFLSDWITPNASAGNGYEARVTNLSNSLTYSSSSATDTWLGLGTTRGWGLESGLNSEQSTTFTLEIRNASTLAVLATASVSILIGDGLGGGLNP